VERGGAAHGSRQLHSGADGTGLGSGFIAVCPPRQVMPSVAGELRIDLGGGMQLLGLHLDDVAQVLRALREEVS
jgi:hypothetical protein